MLQKTRIATNEEKESFLNFIERDNYNRMRQSKTHEKATAESEDHREFISECLENNIVTVTEFDNSEIIVFHTCLFADDGEGGVMIVNFTFSFNKKNGHFEDIEDCDYITL